MPSLRLVTDATAEPVTVQDIKIHLRLQATYTEEDDFLEGLIKVARVEAENKMGRSLLPQTWKLTLDRFASEIILPRAPLSLASSDVKITFLDETSGQSTSLSSTVYTVDHDSEPGRVRLAYGSEWPRVYPAPNAVSIQFVAGYPVNTSAVPSTDTCPEGIEAWIKMRTAGMYEMRESHSERTVQKQPRTFLDGLLDPYVLIEVNP